MSDNIFSRLNKIDASGRVEKKANLSYLSWAWAWGILKENYPTSFSKVYENVDGLNYHHDGKTAWVKTGVSVEGMECIEYLPVMDNRNKSIPIANITSTDVNKAIQRSITKAIARHGLGLYIYAGEDLPDIQDPPLTDVKTKAVREIVESRNVVRFYNFIKSCSDEQKIYAFNSAIENKTTFKAEFKALEKQSSTLAEDYAQQINECCERGDQHGAEQLINELEHQLKKDVQSKLSENAKSAIAEQKEA